MFSAYGVPSVGLGIEDRERDKKGDAAMFDPDFCERRCPICTRARRGHRVARWLQSLELLVTLGGCPWGRARQRKYGVRPDQPLPVTDGRSR